jgi:D-alanyl-D-alanine dipeptidase
MVCWVATLLNLIAATAWADIPQGFVEVRTVNPEILVETAYATTWNFIGKPIDGYSTNQCHLTAPAAKALSNVQKDVSRLGFGLLVYDCYRPQVSVDQFVAWTKEKSDSKMKPIFYPDEPKDKLIERGYIASTSGHTRGDTVDLTLIRKGKYPAKNSQSGIRAVKDCRKFPEAESRGLVDMGTAYDCFSDLAHTATAKVSEQVQKNRMILKSAMEKHGFANYEKEWWHYSLK